MEAIGWEHKCGLQKIRRHGEASGYLLMRVIFVGHLLYAQCGTILAPPCERRQNIWNQFECCFGSLKKQFKCLKAWSELHCLDDVHNQSVTCCMIYNMLLTFDGYKDIEYRPDVHQRGTKLQGIFIPDVDAALWGAGVTEDSDVSDDDEVTWIDRMKTIA
jgi:hypothetical protein